jgi:hypothetical protein
MNGLTLTGFQTPVRVNKTKFKNKQKSLFVKAERPFLFRIWDFGLGI